MHSPYAGLLTRIGKPYLFCVLFYKKPAVPALFSPCFSPIYVPTQDHGSEEMVGLVCEQVTQLRFDRNEIYDGRK